MAFEASSRSATARPRRRPSRRPKARDAPLPRRLSALALSLLFTLAGAALALPALILAVVSVVELIEAVEASRRVGGALLGVTSLVVLAGSVLLIGRVRPWAVGLLCGVEIPRVPIVFAAMWNSPYGAYSGGGGGSCGGDGGGGASTC